MRAPRVNDRRVDEATGQRQRFSSAILPAWARKSPQVAEVLPLLYLHGLSSNDFLPVLEQFLGSSAGLSPATNTRLTKDWQDQARSFNERSLAGTGYVCCWVDGIHLRVRLEQDKVCLLVMIGVHAERAAHSFAELVGAKWPKAVAKITEDLDVLLEFYDYPAEHWIHLRTTNPIESTFATVRLRQPVTKGPGSRTAGTAMAFKLMESAQARWRKVSAPHLVALVRAGARFERVEKESGSDQQVA